MAYTGLRHRWLFCTLQVSLVDKVMFVDLCLRNGKVMTLFQAHCELFCDGVVMVNEIVW